MRFLPLELREDKFEINIQDLSQRDLIFQDHQSNGIYEHLLLKLADELNLWIPLEEAESKILAPLRKTAYSDRYENLDLNRIISRHKLCVLDYIYERDSIDDGFSFYHRISWPIFIKSEIADSEDLDEDTVLEDIVVNKNTLCFNVLMDLELNKNSTKNFHKFFYLKLYFIHMFNEHTWENEIKDFLHYHLKNQFDSELGTFCIFLDRVIDFGEKISRNDKAWRDCDEKEGKVNHHKEIGSELLTSFFKKWMKDERYYYHIGYKSAPKLKIAHHVITEKHDHPITKLRDGDAYIMQGNEQNPTEYINRIANSLNLFFDAHDKTRLLSLLSGYKIEDPLIFKGSVRKICSAFAELEASNVLVCQNIADWISQNFMVLYGTQTKPEPIVNKTALQYSRRKQFDHGIAEISKIATDFRKQNNPIASKKRDSK